MRVFGAGLLLAFASLYQAFAAGRQKFDATGLQDGQVMALEKPPVNPTIALIGTVL